MIWKKSISPLRKVDDWMKVELNVVLAGYTPEPGTLISTGAKLCYSNMDSVNDLLEKESEMHTDRFLDMLSDMGHESPFEHASMTFLIEGVSRSLTHQLVRHRIASYSQRSQRYVSEAHFNYVIPEDIENIPKAKELFIAEMEETQQTYFDLVRILTNKYYEEEIIKDNKTLERYNFEQAMGYFKDLEYTGYIKQMKKLEKRAYENARAVLPNATETKIMVTMNMRSLMHFFNLRTCRRSQKEIRNLANEMFKIAYNKFPSIFKNSGADCVNGSCNEGMMSCGEPLTLHELLGK